MKKIIKIILLMLFLINSERIYSQVTQEWISRFGQAGIDGGNSIVTDNFGNVYVAGAEGYPTSNVDLVTIKYSSSGKQEWLARYNGPGNGRDWANCMNIDTNGDIVVAGTSEGIGSGLDFIVIKYSSNGEQKWFGRYTSQGNQNDEIGDICFDSFNNIYVSGLSNENCVIMKFDSLGNVIWINSYGVENNVEVPRAMTTDKFGNIYITGEGGDSITQVDVTTIKYTPDGIIQWVSRYNSSISENDYGLAIGVDDGGNVYVCGGSQGDLFYDDYITVKYDSSGIEQWNRRYNGSANFLDQARSLLIDNSNNVYITGYSTHAETGYDYTTIKYNANGDQVWLARFNNGLNDMPTGMVMDKNSNLYITGTSDGNGTEGDYATVKYDSSGNLLWIIRYDYSGQYDDYPQALAVDQLYNIYVTGTSNRDFLTMKYHQTITGISTEPLGASTIFNLEQNYPNPFNPSTVISYQLAVSSDVKLKVYDVLGNEVAKLVNKKQNAGNYNIEFDGSQSSSGVYFYRMEVDGNIIDTKRMILLK